MRVVGFLAVNIATLVVHFLLSVFWVYKLVTDSRYFKQSWADVIFSIWRWCACVCVGGGGPCSGEVPHAPAICPLCVHPVPAVCLPSGRYTPPVTLRTPHPHCTPLRLCHVPLGPNGGYQPDPGLLCGPCPEHVLYVWGPRGMAPRRRFLRQRVDVVVATRAQQASGVLWEGVAMRAVGRRSAFWCWCRSAPRQRGAAVHSRCRRSLSGTTLC